MNDRAAHENSSAIVRFGSFEFDPYNRQITKHGIRLKVHEQPLQVLAALLEQPGQIVSREELQRRLWPEGTFVDFEQSLNKAVNKLREALGDSADHPVYIETLARRGYRFLAPVEANGAAAPAVATAPSRRGAWPWLAAGLAVLVVILGTGLWPVEVPQVERVVQLTSDRTNKNLPVADGSRVMYSDGRNLWSVPASGGESKKVPLPFLSPSSLALAILPAARAPRNFLLVSCQNEMGAAELWLVRPDGDAARKIGEIETQAGIALAPDGERLALSLQDGIYIQSIATGERRRIQTMQWKGPSYLWWHPSGRVIGFLDIPEYQSKTRAWQVNDDGTHLRRIVPEMEEGQGAGAWSPDGKRFYYFSLAQGGEIFVRTKAGILGWLRKSAVTRLTASGQFKALPTVDPLDPKRLYVPSWVPQAETVRYDRAARRWVQFLANFSGEHIETSPDGQSMVYVKYPSAELHKCKVDGSGDIVLASGVVACNPHWSPDRRRIAFAGRRMGINQDLKLWLVSASGGDAAPYRPEIESGFDTIWSNDGKRILMGQYETNVASGESRIKGLDLETGKVEQIPGGERLFSPRWSPDGKQLCALGRELGNLYLFEPLKRQWRELSKLHLSYPTWSSDGKYIYGAWYDEDLIGRIAVTTGRREEIVRVDFKRAATSGDWVGWTKDWDPIVLRDAGSNQIYRIDLDR